MGAHHMEVPDLTSSLYASSLKYASAFRPIFLAFCTFPISGNRAAAMPPSCNRTDANYDKHTTFVGIWDATFLVFVQPIP